MVSNLLLLMGAFFAVALVYRFRKPILGALDRFDRRNAARQVEESWEKRHRLAHYRRAVLTAEESLEEVAEIKVSDERTGQPVNRYRFLGELFATREDAEAVRRARAVEIAREFYAELDGRSLPRRPPTEAAPTALAAPEDEVTPPRPS
jgi:hypothetical protein